MKKSILLLLMIFFWACSEDAGTNANGSFNATKVCPESKRGTFVDERDGQVYKYTTIGGQVWMAQNLNYDTPDSNVDVPPEMSDSIRFLRPLTGEKEAVDTCENCEINGRLYNWYAAYYSCPKGWHLPSNKERDRLIKTMGGNEFAGTRLRANYSWIALNRGENINGTDDCGFSVISPDGGLGVSFWSATISTPNSVCAWTLLSYKNSVGTPTSVKADEDMSYVRCIKD